MTSLPCIEFVKVIVNDAYTEDPTISKPGLEAVSRASGCIDMWMGREEQDSQNLFLINAWESLKHHQEFMEDMAKYQPVKDGLTLVMQTLTYLFHVYFAEEPYTALSAPLTEVAIFTVKNEFPTNEAVRIVAELVDALNNIPAEVGGYGGATWGPVVENSRQFVLVFGWKDMQSYTDVRQNPDAAGMFAKVVKYFDRDVKHVALSKFAPHSE